MKAGQEAEVRAAAALVAAGYTIVATNWRCDSGELDLVARDRGVLVFVEVRSRSSVEHGHAAEMVGARKRRHVERVAEVYLAIERPIEDDVRFDVVAVTGDEVCILRDAWRVDGP